MSDEVNKPSVKNYVELQQEYTQACAKLGDAVFRKELLSNEQQRIFEQLTHLTKLAEATKRVEEETKEQQPQ